LRPLEIIVGDHDPPLHRTGITLDRADELIEYHRIDPIVGERGLEPGNHHDIVGSKQFFHELSGRAVPSAC